MSSESIEVELSRAGLVLDRDGLWVDARRDVAVVVVPSGGYVIGWLDVDWPSPSEPTSRLRGTKHVPAADLLTALGTTRRNRAQALRTCRHCRKRSVPGHMLSADLCQSCAASEYGVVY